MNGTVIQGRFPRGIPKHLTSQPSPAHAQPAGSDAFVLPLHLSAFGRRPGQKLAPAVQQKMESFFKADFSDVQVHVGPEAASLGALAFTHGSHIYFAPGEYNVATPVGQQLLAHELAHVVQQRSGRVRNPFRTGVAVLQDRHLEAEAERIGAAAAAYRPASARGGSGCGCEGTCGCGSPGDHKHAVAQPSAKHTCATVPDHVRRRIGLIVRKTKPSEAQAAFSRALPGLVQQMKMALGPPPPALRLPLPPPSSRVVQRAICRRANAQATEWYTRTGAQVALAINAAHGMHIDNDIAHVLCCAFCEAQIRTLAEGGGLVGSWARYTMLFERLVHRYSAYVGGQNIFTEEVYWIPASPAQFNALAGGGGGNALVFDHALWGNIHAAILATLGALAPGAFPTGLPVAAHAAFTPAWTNLQAEPPPAAAPADPRRRSFAGFTIRLSALYAFLQLINQHAPVGGGASQWRTLRRLRGRVRILDFTGESGGGQPAVVDAKFSYGANFDNWGPGQAADQLTVHQALPGGPGPAVSVPAVTWHLCRCSQQELKDRLFAQKDKEVKAASGKRKADERKQRAEDKYQKASENTRFISSADVKWVK